MSCKEKFKKTVRIELIHRGWTTAELAVHIGRTRESVSAVLNDRRRFPKTRQLICKELGIDSETGKAKQ